MATGDANPSSYTVAADIYSFGLVCWEIATGKYPFAGKNTFEVVRMIGNNERPEIPSDINPAFSLLVRLVKLSEKLSSLPI